MTLEVKSTKEPLSYHLKNMDVFFSLSEKDVMMLKGYTSGRWGSYTIDTTGTNLKYKTRVETFKHPATLDEIVDKACEVLLIPKDVLMAESRANRLPEKRALIYKIANREHRHTLISIGKYFGKHHSSIIHGINTINDLMLTDKNVKQTYEVVHEAIKQEFGL
jgi:chromosomal replication initiation ATPase DnaA